MNTVSYPLIHLFKRANTPKQEVLKFFGSIKVHHDHQKVLSWIDRVYDNKLTMLCGLTKLKEEWEEAGATKEQIQTAFDYFKPQKDIYYKKDFKDFKKLLVCLLKDMLNFDGTPTYTLINNYFYNRRGRSTPRGLALLRTDKNLYEIVNKNKIKQILRYEFGLKDKTISNKLLGDISSIDKIEPTANLFKCANGIYDFNKKEFKQKMDTPTYIIKETNYNYDKNLINRDTPEDLKKLFVNLYKAEVNDLLEVIGYLLTDGNPLKICPVFIGDNDTGKTLIQKIISELLNNKTSNVNIFNFKETNTSLVTENLNLISEFRECRNIEAFKSITGNEPIEFRKLYNNAELIPAEEISKTLLSTNNFNELANKFDKSLFGRFSVFIEFKRNYKEKDEGLFDRIIKNKETMDWLLTNSIHAYVESNGKIQAQHTNEEIIKLIDTYDNPIEWEILQQYFYIEPNDQESYLRNNELSLYNGMDDREYIIKYGVSVAEIKAIFEKHGKTTRHITKELNNFFDTTRKIKTKSYKIKGEMKRYIIGLVKNE